MTEPLFHSTDFGCMVSRLASEWIDYYQGNTETPPRLEEFLSAYPTAQARRGVLALLIPIDMEMRWQGPAHRTSSQQRILPADGVDQLGRCPRLEDYVRLFPELGSVDELPPELILHERELREEIRLEYEYCKRFPKHFVKNLADPKLSGLDELSTVSVIKSVEPLTVPVQAKDCWTPPVDQVAAKLGRRFSIRRPEIGRGSFGAVYMAEDHELHPQVAVKILRPGTSASEGRIMAKLDHPHLVRVYNIDSLPDGTVFLVMEYLPGGTLRDRLLSDPAHPSHTKPLDPLQVVAYMRRIVEALAYLHRKGLIHLDVKPSNILFKPDNTLIRAELPCITDFGMTCRLDRQHSWEDIPLGTPLYMAPEQAASYLLRRGRAVPAQVDFEVDGRTDVWASGVMLYEMLTGYSAFVARAHKRGSNPYADLDDLAEQIICHIPPDPREINPAIPDRLAALCLACLSKRKDERPIAQDLARQLGTIEGALSLEVDVEPSENMHAEVTHCPRFVSVPTEWVLPEWIAVFVRLTSEYDLAMALLNKAQRLRRSVDSDATCCMPKHDRTARIDAFWSDVLRQACVHGARMLAALVVVIPPGWINDEDRPAFLKSRTDLLQQLWTLSHSPTERSGSMDI